MTSHTDVSLSVVLPTDTYDTIRTVVEHLRRQTVRSRLEVVVVTPLAPAARDAMAHLAEFAAVRVVEVAASDSLATARAAGVRAASAPVVFVGETHTYPHPEWAEALIRAHEKGWAAVAPAFGNANPDGRLSWAGFLADYGPWIEGLPAREVDAVPLYNTAYRRSVLLELGARLPHALSHGDELALAMRARGHRAYFEPAARIDHVNVTRPAAWVHERFLAGVLIGGSRGARWSRLRRLAYVCGSPLIPLVLLSRTLPGVRAATRGRRLPRGTLLAIVVGLVIKAAGEMVGYARGAGTLAERLMDEYETHKVAHTTGNRA